VGERLPFFLADPDVPSPFKSSVASAREFGLWASEQKDSWPQALELHYDAYMSLLDNEIQRIWVGLILLEEPMFSGHQADHFALAISHVPHTQL
jgi:hypothetical protein